MYSEGLAGDNRRCRATNLGTGVQQLGRVLVGTADVVSLTPQHVRTYVTVTNVVYEKNCFSRRLIDLTGNGSEVVAGVAIHDNIIRNLP